MTPHIAERRLRPRNLVIVRAGDASLHRKWIADPRRDFDLFISHDGTDATAGRHTRPIGDDLCKNNPGWDPIDDEARLQKRHGLTAVRSPGRYAGWRRVREVPLAPAQRLALWLERLNGQRRLARHA